MPIPIMDMLIHRITPLLHDSLNLAKEFSGKTSEKDLEERIKNKFELIKKPRVIPSHPLTIPQ